MRKILIASAALLFTTMASAHGAPKSNDKTIDHDFTRLSVDGQKAFADIYQAQKFLSANQTTQALPLLQDAQVRLQKAAKDNRKFMKAESELTPASSAPPKSTTHVVSNTPESWVPVVGLYVVTDEMAPEKKAALNTANQHLQQGQPQQAAQDLQVVGQDVDFIMGLAPLEKTTATVYRASVLLDGGDQKDSIDALDQVLDNVVFVEADSVESLAPATPAAPRPTKKAS